MHMQVSALPHAGARIALARRQVVLDHNHKAYGIDSEDKHDMR